MRLLLLALTLVFFSVPIADAQKRPAKPAKSTVKSLVKTAKKSITHRLSRMRRTKSTKLRIAVPQSKPVARTPFQGSPQKAALLMHNHLGNMVRFKEGVMTGPFLNGTTTHILGVNLQQRMGRGHRVSDLVTGNPKSTTGDLKGDFKVTISPKALKFFRETVQVSRFKNAKVEQILGEMLREAALGIGVHSGVITVNTSGIKLNGERLEWNINANNL